MRTMFRLGKRSFGKIGAIFVIVAFAIIVISSLLMSSQEETPTERKNIVQLRIKPIQGRVRSRLAMRKSPLGPNKYLSKNVSWHHRSRLGSSKHNVTAQLSRKNASIAGRKRNTGYTVLKTKEDIKEVLLKLKDKGIFGKGDKGSKVRSQNEGSCTPIMNVAYIKTHKTASTTLQTVTNRFGLRNKLSFVLNKISPQNGHFVYLPVTKDSPRLFFLPPIGVTTGNFSQYQYNMIAVHLRYNRSAMESFMLPGTKYISIIREPSAHFESAFDHFRFSDSFSPATKCRVIGREIEEFMRKPGYYRRKLKKLPWDTARGLRWYYARNNQIFDLGLDSKYHDNEVVVNRTIDILHKELDLVLISEYFDESLVVLKRMMCWSFDDIVYVSKNQRLTRVSMEEETRRRIRAWSRADTLLYERFNTTLWRKIREYGLDFERDLATFRKRKEEVFERCAGNETIKAHGIFKHREYSPSANSSLFCTLVAESKTRLFHRVWLQQAGEWNKKLKASRNKIRTGAAKNSSAVARKPAMEGLGMQDENGHKLDGERRDSDTKNGGKMVVENGIWKDGDHTAEKVPKKNDCNRDFSEEDIDFQSSNGNNLVFPEQT